MQNDVDVGELSRLICQMTLEIDRRDPIYDQVVESARDTNIVRWHNIESNEDVQEAVVDETSNDQVKSSAPEHC